MKSIFLLFVLTFTYGAADESLIDPSLLREMKSGKPVNVFVVMNGGNDEVIDDINSQTFASREDKINAIVQATRANSALSQAGVLNYIRSTPLSFETLPLSNEVYVRNAGPLAIMALAALPNVASVREEKLIPLSIPVAEVNTKQFQRCDDSNRKIEWGVEAIGAPAAWKAGYNGTGMVVAIIDTGVSMRHKDLQNFRGGKYSWMDFPSTFPIMTRTPTDYQGHGTHVCGSAVGQNGVGVAPGAKWMACRGCGLLNCPEFNLKTCGEWVVCPYEIGGTSASCQASQAPHVVNNSWGGGKNDTWYNGIISKWLSAGIVPVFAAGNSGPECSTLGSPGDQPNNIGVAATNSSNNVAKFSSRGPPLASGNGNILNKPDLAAPGEGICSCSNWFKNSRFYMSGTSMASPHVAGAAALVVQAAGNKLAATDANRYKKVMDYLQKSSVKSVSTGQTCGEARSDNDYPNYQVGSGIIDVYAATAEAAQA